MRVDMNVRGENKETALVAAVKSGKNSTAKALLAAGADTKARDNGGHYAPDWAATNADANLAEAIVRHGA